jgi:hypothetical protein
MFLRANCWAYGKYICGRVLLSLRRYSPPERKKGKESEYYVYADEKIVQGESTGRSL